MVKMRFYLCGAERSCLTARLQRHFVPLTVKSNNEFRTSDPGLFGRTNSYQVQLRCLHHRPGRLGSALPLDPYITKPKFSRGIQIPAEGWRRTRTIYNPDFFPHEAEKCISENVPGFSEKFTQMQRNLFASKNYV